MDHVAILKKSLGLMPKLRSGHKTIESRWYQSKRAPWGRIKANDTVYFKNSGEPVTLKAKVLSVISLSDLTPEKVGQLLSQYGSKIGIEAHEIPTFFERLKDKQLCLLIFLDKPETVKPFQIDKTGFGMMSAWLSVHDIQSITAPKTE
ncbi:hypothetical protein HZA44_01030 [Candidatus Peregrinibacteria bacterium]|nr:hypothetical protein [Candidatus Peregrinibacteria bacterium]